GLLGIPSADRASIDLGELEELPEEHAHASKLPVANPADLSLVADTAAAAGSGEDGATNVSEPLQPSSGTVDEAMPLQTISEDAVAGIELLQNPILDGSHSQDTPNAAMPTDTTTDVHDSAENAVASAAALAEDISSVQAALARYSMVVDQDQTNRAPTKDDDHDGDEKHSWRRRGSLLTSRLAAPLRSSSSKDGASLNSSRVVMRKDSTPLFSPSLPHKTNHHLFHRSESGDAANKSSSFWRSGSTLRSSVHAGDDAIPSISSEIASAATTATCSPPPERTHRSSS
ncbi:hypothetical protein GGI21_006705, partial [Coemansia aciculifera]